MVLYFLFDFLHITDVDRDSIIGEAKDEFGSAVIAGNDIGRIFALLVEHLAAAEVADLDHTGFGEQHVLGLEVPVRDLLVVDVLESVKELVHVILREGGGTLMSFYGMRVAALEWRSMRDSRLSSTNSKTMFWMSLF